jgi:hypothetical protein
MSAWERELGALPAPICPCSTERPGRDLLFLGIVLVLLLVLVIEGRNIGNEKTIAATPNVI